MNIQDILDDLDAGEHIPNNVVRELCNRVLELERKDEKELGWQIAYG